MTVVSSRTARTIGAHMVAALGLAVVALQAGISNSAFGQSWTPIGPRGASIVAMTRSPNNPGHVYACAFSGGVHESTNGGLSWTHLAAPFSNQYVFDLAVDPVDPAILYVSSFELGIFKSVDGGASWTQINNGLGDLTVHDIEILPSSGTLLAATDTTVYYSTDGGQTWSAGAVGVEKLFASGLLVDPLNGTNAYAKTIGRGIYRSLDGGQTWSQLTNGLTNQDINGLHVDTRDFAWVYASTSSGFFRIPYADFHGDSGAWQNFGFNLDESQIFEAITLPNTGILVPTPTGVFEFDGVNTWNLWADIPSRLLFATADGGLIHVAGVLDVLAVTADQGNTFFPASAGIQNRFVGALRTVDVFGWTVIYGGDDKGLELTSEFFRDGDTLPWILSKGFDSAVFDVAVRPGTPDTFYAAVERNGVWKATDFGNVWTPVSNGMVPRRINDLAQSRTGSHLYAATTEGIYFSEDGGDTWKNEGNVITPRDATAVAAHTETDQIAYYGTNAGQVFRTFSGGEAFLAGWPGVGQAITDLAIAPFFDVYAVLEDGSLYSSTDDGANFFPLDGLAGEHVMQVVVDPVRPWYAYAATRTGGVYKTVARGLEWSEANTGITNPGIFCIDIAYDDANLLYAGATGVVFKTTDGAENWTPLTNGLPAGKVTGIHISETDLSVVYATVDEESVYRTVDGGQTWQLFYDEPDNGEALPFLSDAVDASRLYAGALGEGLQRSTDGGLSWAASSDGMRLFMRSLAADWEHPDTLYAGSLNNGMFKTVDGGNSWTPVGLEEYIIFRVIVDPNDSSTVYAGTASGVFGSRDAGQTWQSFGQLSDIVFDVVVDSTNPNRIYASGMAGQIVRSTDNGQSWTHIKQGVTGHHVLTLALDEQAQILYAAPEFAPVFRSNDGGDTWTEAGTGLMNFKTNRLFVAANGDLYAGTQQNGLYRSVDLGETFDPVAAPLDENFVSAIAAPASDPNFMLLAIRTGTPGVRPVYRSLDAGATWEPASTGIPDSSVIDLDFNADETIAYAAGIDALYRSLDQGSTWEWVADYGAGSEVTSFRVDSADPNVFFAGTTAGGILVSTDAGATWQTAPDTTGLSVARLARRPGGSVLAATLGTGIVRSDNSGASWTMGASPLLIHTQVLDLAVHPTNPGVLYAATGGGGVHKTLDGGVTWFPINNGISDLILLTLLLDPFAPDTLYAGSTEGGVFRTIDGGATWEPLSDGLFNLTITALTLDANDHTIIYAGTEGGGVFKIDL